LQQRPNNPAYQQKPLKPRKVRGGIKLLSSTGRYPDSWPAQRWMRLVEQAAPGDAMVEGLGYATAGQTRRFGFDAGRIAGAVQGTNPAAYEVMMTLQPFTHEQTERVIASMIDQAVYAAKLLAGELPANIEDVFAPLGLKLFPVDPSEVVPTCSCRTRRMTSFGPRPPMTPGTTPSTAPPPLPVIVEPTGPVSPWCKHVCCIAYLAAERFTTDPFLIFTLRGLPREELLERLRQRRAAAGSGTGGAMVYSATVPGVSDKEPVPLEQCVESFWDSGPGLDHVDMPIEPPEVSHPLLRRLGPSPFGGPGRFPLVGLLATCYEVISEAAIKGVGEEKPPLMGADEHGLEREEVVEAEQDESDL